MPEATTPTPPAQFGGAGPADQGKLPVSPESLQSYISAATDASELVSGPQLLDLLQ